MTEKYRQILITSLLWFITLFVVIFIGVNNVFADTYGSFENITVKTLMYVSPDYSNSPIEVPVNSSYNLNQVRQMDILVNNYSFTANTHYQLEFVLTNTTLQYANKFTVSGSNGESCVISYDLSLLTGYWLYFDFQCPHATSNITISVSNSNNSYLWDASGTTIFSWERSQIRSSDTPLTGSGTDTDNIINNNNQNTQSIINNQNQNTQDIINNQNQNTQNIIDSNQLCKFYDYNNIKTDNYYLHTNGTTYSNTSAGITDYIKIDKYSKIYLVDYYNYSILNYCFYDSKKTVISCANPNVLSAGDLLTIPNNSSYFRATIYKPVDKPTYNICVNSNLVISDDNKEAETTRKGILAKLGDLFNTLFSNEDADVSGLNNMVGWLPPGPLDSIINLPLNFFNSLTNTLTGTCSPVSLTIPFVNQVLILPCFDAYMSQYLSGFSTLWTFVGVTLSVFILYNYLLNLYKWVDDTLTLRENNLPGYYDDRWGGGA